MQTSKVPSWNTFQQSFFQRVKPQTVREKDLEEAENMKAVSSPLKQKQIPSSCYSSVFRVQEELDYKLEFKDSSLQDRFMQSQRLKVTQTKINYYILFTVLVSLFYIPQHIIQLQKDHHKINDSVYPSVASYFHLILSIIGVVSAVLFFVLHASYILSTLLNQNWFRSSQYEINEGSFSFFVRTAPFSVFCVQLLFSVIFLRYVCSLSDNTDFSFATLYEVDSALKNFILQALMLFCIPSVIFSHLPYMPMICVWLNFLIICGVLIACVIFVEAWSALPVCACWLGFAYMIIREGQMQRVELFLQETLSEKMPTEESVAKIEDDKKDVDNECQVSEEMRHMIANVAHDLKTVRFSVVCSILDSLVSYFIF